MLSQTFAGIPITQMNAKGFATRSRPNNCAGFCALSSVGFGVPQ
jgi:hypothetical protein